MLFGKCSLDRNNNNNIEQNLVCPCCSTLICRQLSIFLVLLLITTFLWFNYTVTSSDSPTKHNYTIYPDMINRSSFPTLARTLYLFLCENQAEIDSYSKIFPSASADAMFYCWRENCDSSKFLSTKHLYVNSWSSKTKRDEKLVSFQPISSFYHIQSRIFIINERQLNATKKMTWTTSRNTLYELAVSEERKQGWAWSYHIYVDGDIHTACPLAKQLLTNENVTDYGGHEEYLFAPHFYEFINLIKISAEEQKCYLLFDAFLLSISPAIATIRGAGGDLAYPGVLSQIVYHIDAMFNAIQHDALPFLLPYCPRYDKRSWWTSQAIFVYRSLCLYGHTLLFDGLHIVKQNHRSYPRQGNAWAMDNDMNLVPNHLRHLQDYMKQNSLVSPIVLDNYGGWNLELTSDICRRNHRAITLDTCLVH